MQESRHPTGGVGALLLHPSLLQEAHHQLVVGAAHKLGVPESDQHIAHKTYFSVFKWKLMRDYVYITCGVRDHWIEGKLILQDHGIYQRKEGGVGPVNYL